MSYIIASASIADVFTLEPKIFGEPRVFFFESFNAIKLANRTTSLSLVRLKGAVRLVKQLHNTNHLKQERDMATKQIGNAHRHVVMAMEAKLGLRLECLANCVDPHAHIIGQHVAS